MAQGAVAAAAVTVVLGREREGEQRRGEARERVRAVQGGAWHPQGVGEIGSEAGGGLGVCPRAPASCLRPTVRGGRRQGWLRWWAGLLQ